jgi:hypothetical protein
MMPARPGFRHCAATIFGRVFFLALCSTPVHAQQRYLLEETTAANGKAAVFEAAQKDYCAAVLRGGAPQCLVFSPTTFSPGDLFFTLLRFSSFRHYDEGTYTSKGLTPEQAAELESRRRPTVTGNRESALTLHEEVSYSSSDPGNLVIVTDFTIRPGTLPTLLVYLRKVELPEAHRAGLLSSELYQVVAGGETNRFLLFRRIERFAQLDQIAPFGDTLPQSATASASIANCVLSNRTTVMLTRKVSKATP